MRTVKFTPQHKYARSVAERADFANMIDADAFTSVGEEPESESVGEWLEEDDAIFAESKSGTFAHSKNESDDRYEEPVSAAVYPRISTDSTIPTISAASRVSAVSAMEPPMRKLPKSVKRRFRKQSHPVIRFMKTITLLGVISVSAWALYGVGTESSLPFWQEIFGVELSSLADLLFAHCQTLLGVVSPMG